MSKTPVENVICLYKEEIDHADVLSILNGFTAEMVKEIFPEGLRTAEAVYLRACAYCDVPITEQESRLCTTAQCIVDLIKKYRHDPEWQPRAGHKRAVLLVMLACVAQRASTFRKLTPKMQTFISTTFPAEFCKAFLYYCCSKRQTPITWSKDGVTRTISVSQWAVNTSRGGQAVLDWAKAPWPKTGQ